MAKEKLKLTEEQIRTRSVVLDLKYGALINSLHYTISTDFGYNKFSTMTAKQAVDLLLEHHEDRTPESTELERAVRAFTQNEKDLYTIQLPTGALVCEVDRSDLYNPKTDNRNELLKEYLEDLADKTGKLIWAARMYLVEKTILG